MSKPFSQCYNTTSQSNSLFSSLIEIIENSKQKSQIKLGINLFGCKNAPTCDFIRFLSLLEIKDSILNVIPVPETIINTIESFTDDPKKRLAGLGSAYNAIYLYQYLDKIPADKCEEIYKIAITNEQLVKSLVDELPWQVKRRPFSWITNNNIKIGMELAQLLPNLFGLRDSINEKYDSNVEEEVFRALKKCMDAVDERYSCENYDWTRPVNLRL